MRSPFRASAAVAAVLLLGACGGNPRGAPVRVTIPQGSSFHAATDSLAAHGLLNSPKLFRAYATARGKDRGIKAGTYMLQRGTSWDDLLQALSVGRALVHTITVPEGFSLTAIAALLERTMKAHPDSIAVAMRDTALLRELDVPTPMLEGYLFPDTYVFPDGVSPRHVVKTMVEQFKDSWEPSWDARLETLKMTRHDVITLASIIEKEARLAEERPVISAVYHNRLRIGMALQADPTVQYAMGVHTNRVLFKHLKTASPYNTYRNPGLPPGPICSPGKASIDAALHPADVPYLYFVAHPDGHHEFRSTFAEHTRAIREIRRKQRAAAAATPAKP
jgi:UPF0755 protein